MKNKHLFLVVFSILALLTFVYGVNAAEPNIILKDGHIPTYDGINQTWFKNAANVPVHLSFTAPWDLTNGPKQKTFTAKWIETKDAFNGDTFATATCAVERTIAGQKSYYFYKKIKNGLYWLGCSTPPSNPDIANFSFAPAVRTILLPAKTGKKVTQNSVYVTAGGNSSIKVTVKIIGKGIVIVGAGTFNDAVMVQQKVEIVGEQTYFYYEWYAPFVGLVAHIESLGGEKDELFTTAAVFEWMKSCAMP